MEPHHVIEAVGIVVLGLVFYSYALRWLQSERVPRAARARLRIVVNGLAFGILPGALMISRLEVGEGGFVDARAVPIALITLVEGGWAGLIAALVACLYRVAWLGGSGARAGRPRRAAPAGRSP